MKIYQGSVAISNPEKLLFPGTGITKSDLITYYLEVADLLLPFLKNRPLMLQRLPQGITKPGFYQKDIGDSFPEWLKRVSVPRENKSNIAQAVINSQKALEFIINQNTITLHPWLSTIKDLYKPDKLIFDLDPAGSNFKSCVNAAQWLQEILEQLYNLNCYVMTTGSSGLHVTVPIRVEHGFDTVRNFARKVGEQLAAEFPDDFTTEQRIADRNGRLFLDYLRNGFAQTAVAPFSVRALPGAPVATPLFWEELKDKNLHAQRFNLKNMATRLKETNNPWHDFRKRAKSLNHALATLKKLT